MILNVGCYAATMSDSEKDIVRSLAQSFCNAYKSKLSLPRIIEIITTPAGFAEFKLWVTKEHNLDIRLIHLFAGAEDSMNGDFSEIVALDVTEDQAFTLYLLKQKG